MFAQTAALTSGLIPSPAELAKIGVVAATKGMVEVTTPGAAGRIVQSGEEIFIGDEVRTDAAGHLQILLLDETVFTIGPNSAITIDKFIYDPKTHDGHMQASIVKGVFRYISGKIAAKKPEHVTIRLPTATIGIRGTIVAGEVSAAGSMATLLGPGSRNETGATIGSFVMTGTGENTGKREHVTRSGFGVSADLSGSLSGVFQVPEAQLQHLTTALLPTPGPMRGMPDQENNPRASPALRPADQKPVGFRPPPGTLPKPSLGMPVPSIRTADATSPGTDSGTASVSTIPYFGTTENMTKISGEQTYLGFQTTDTIRTIDYLQNNYDQTTTIASQDAMHNTAMVSTRAVRDTLNHDMFAHANGTEVYKHLDGRFVFNNLPGVLSAVIEVDFTSNKIVGGDSHITVRVPDGVTPGTLLTDTCSLSDQAFDTALAHKDYPAKFVWTGVTGTSGTFTNIEVQFQDVLTQTTDGAVPSADIAAQAKVTVQYTNSTLNGTGQLIAPQV